jgi:hypothetical protein
MIDSYMQLQIWWLHNTRSSDGENGWEHGCVGWLGNGWEQLSPGRDEFTQVFPTIPYLATQTIPGKTWPLPNCNAVLLGQGSLRESSSGKVLGSYNFFLGWGIVAPSLTPTVS